jgi:antibiotic biosynthesis monooxygenase (ABM) superfamily enzyme
MREMADRWPEELGPGADGWLGGTYGFTDDGQFVAVVRFENREKAMANSRRPEQSAWAEQLMALMDGPPEFHDSEAGSTTRSVSRR